MRFVSIGGTVFVAMEQYSTKLIVDSAARMVYALLMRLLAFQPSLL